MLICQNVMCYCTALSTVFHWICTLQVFSVIIIIYCPVEYLKLSNVRDENSHDQLQQNTHKKITHQHVHLDSSCDSCEETVFSGGCDFIAGMLFSRPVLCT